MEVLNPPTTKRWQRTRTGFNVYEQYYLLTQFVAFIFYIDLSLWQFIVQVIYMYVNNSILKMFDGVCLLNRDVNNTFSRYIQVLTNNLSVVLLLSARWKFSTMETTSPTRLIDHVIFTFLKKD